MEKRASGFGVGISRVPTLTPSDLSLSASEDMELFYRHLNRCHIYGLVGADDLQLHSIQSTQTGGIPRCQNIIIYRRGRIVPDLNPSLRINSLTDQHAITIEVCAGSCAFDLHFAIHFIKQRWSSDIDIGIDL